MESWIYFVVFSQITLSGIFIIDKFVFSKNYVKSPLAYAVLTGISASFVIFLLPFKKFSMLSYTDSLIAFLASITFIFAIVLYYMAINYDEISKIAIMFQLVPVFVLALSVIFLNEMLTSKRLAGFFILLVAGIIVSYKKTNAKFGINKAFYYILASAFLLGISWITSKHILSVTNFWNGFMWFRITTIPALFFLFFPKVRREFSNGFKKMKDNTRKLLAIKIIADFLAAVFIEYALFIGPASLVSSLSASLTPLFVFIFALAISLCLPKIMKEEIGARSIFLKFIAISMVAVGIFMINS